MTHTVNIKLYYSEPKRSYSDNPLFSNGWSIQRIILLMILLQSIGIRALPMQGVLFSLLICLILAPRIAIPLRQFLSFIILCVIFVFLSTRAMSSYTNIAYLTLILFAAFFFVRYVETRWAEVEFDLLIITWWLSLHGLISYLAYKVLPSIFSTFLLGEMKYKVFGVFVLSGFEPYRATGLCWEPGLLQYVANISLFLGIKHSWPRWKLAVSLFTVVATFSTTGIFVLAPTMLYSLFVRRRSLRQWIPITATLAIIVALSMSVFLENITDKLGGENISGLIRLRDLQVGWELIKQKPLLGHGQFDENYLLTQSNIWEIATELFNNEYLSGSGDMSGGYTNGFLGFFASYGIFIGAFTFWCFFNNCLIQGGMKERFTFFFISILTFIAEPIANTTWYFVLAISGIYSRQLRERFLVIKKKLMPQANRIYNSQ